MIVRALVVDDEPPARRKLIRFLNAEPDIEVLGEAGTVAEAITAIEKRRPDLVFLDVQMPDGDGFDVVRALPDPDAIHFVFVTAHGHYALQAFEVQALDYLLKPVDPKRFETVMARVRKHLERSNRPEHKLEALLRDIQAKPRYVERLLLDLGERSVFVSCASVDCLESARNYVQIHAQGEIHTVRGTLESFAAQLDPRKFVQINRSQIVNLDSILEMQPWFHGEYRVILKDKRALTWTRRFSPGKPATVPK